MSRASSPLSVAVAGLCCAASMGMMFRQLFAPDPPASLARAIEERPRPANFIREVSPLLHERCGRCHGPDKQQGGLRLDSLESALAGGDSGNPAITPKKPERSELLARITSPDPALQMPPKGPRLSTAETALVKRWIEEGADWPDVAKWPKSKSWSPDAAPPKSVASDVRNELRVIDADREHWAYLPLRAPAPPAVVDEAWVKTPVDRFVRAAQEARGLAPVAEADRATLVRRAYYDLHGLPPTPEEAEEFVRDDRPDAWERLIDRLLAHPRYGERWARHWLDLARYAETDGFELDVARPYAFTYRDFVIRALNDDLPYDVFLRWQLAGDEIAPADPEAVAATGFIAAGPSNDDRNKIEEERRRDRAEELDDVLCATGQAMLGLTIGCARCHDHKYDAIPTRDYYRLAAAFANVKRTERELPKRTADPQEKPGRVLAVSDASAKPEPSHLLVRGDVTNRGDVVTMGFLTVLTRAKPPESYLEECRAAPHAAQATTHQRHAVARWITDVENGAGALAARVAVNRVWMLHFGEGLVRTPGDFGVRGDAPTHPALLDWLASRFVAEGWSLKRLHRLIMTSATYRLGVAFDPARAGVDPDERLLWRRRPRRLEAEALRDALLATAGVLDDKMYGSPVGDTADAELERRRSIYRRVGRNKPDPLMRTFDAPAPSGPCARRATTTVAPQALALLNDPFVRARATDLADRLRREAGPDDAARVERAYRLTFSRPPRADELGAGLAFLESRATARVERGEPPNEARRLACVDFCQALFGANEFVYVD